MPYFENTYRVYRQGENQDETNMDNIYGWNSGILTQTKISILFLFLTFASHFYYYIHVHFFNTFTVKLTKEFLRVWFNIKSGFLIDPLLKPIWKSPSFYSLPKVFNNNTLSLQLSQKFYDWKRLYANSTILHNQRFISRRNRIKLIFICIH